MDSGISYYVDSLNQKKFRHKCRFCLVIAGIFRFTKLKEVFISYASVLPITIYEPNIDLTKSVKLVDYQWATILCRELLINVSRLKANAM